MAAGDLVQADVAHNLMQLIAEGGGDGEEDDADEVSTSLLL